MVCIRKKERKQGKDMKYILKLKAVRKASSRKQEIRFSKAYLISSTFSGTFPMSVFLSDTSVFASPVYFFMVGTAAVVCE